MSHNTNYSGKCIEMKFHYCLFIILEHVPLFRHGLLEHGLESIWQALPYLYWSHWHVYCCNEFSTQLPRLEQLPKHADKSPVYVDRMLFNWLPVLFWLNKYGELILKKDTVEVSKKFSDKENKSDVSVDNVDEWKDKGKVKRVKLLADEIEWGSILVDKVDVLNDDKEVNNDVNKLSLVVNGEDVGVSAIGVFDVDKWKLKDEVNESLRALVDEI